MSRIIQDENTHPSLLERKIIHIDMDAFYASIEMRDNPSLIGKPIVVGGSPDSRGVVCTASYEARRYGIRSAMPSSHAARLCPHAIFLKPRFEAYHKVSTEIREIFQRYTDLVEPLSLDEAYLDVTKNKKGLYASTIAREIKNTIRRETKLTCSAGVAPNKLVAKIASDFYKPDGLTVVLPAEVLEFMRRLPVRVLFGVGPVSEKQLHAAGIRYCSDLWNVSEYDMTGLGLSHFTWLLEEAKGIDPRPVDPTWIRKSMGREETYQEDILSTNIILDKLEQLSRTVAENLREDGIKGRTVTLKVKYSDFIQVTRSKTLEEATYDCEKIFKTSKGLLDRTHAGVRKIRLLGISLSNLENI
ncbi:MAG: DNA polymerase IV [Oligoflexales bacterium]|nr:DNA polymerase IV [Oligoflexales bacterium]